MPSKKPSLNDMLNKRNPLAARQVITPVDVLAPEETERVDRTVTPNERTEKTNAPTERAKRKKEPRKRPVKPSGTSERINRTVFDDLELDSQDEKRKTERYSFEIYTDQKGSIEELQYLYKKRTGKKLSASRIIREALEDYLSRALTTFQEKER